MSPNNAERVARGYSLHGCIIKRGKKQASHGVLWIDYSVDKEKGICGMGDGPVKYVVEMYVDRVSV